MQIKLYKALYRNLVNLASVGREATYRRIDALR
jgi:hypothetical protein